MVADEKALKELPGIGKDLGGKIAEICRTGKFLVLEECRSRVSPGIRKLLRIQGLGPKRIRVLCEELKITGLEDLRRATEGGQLEDIRGFGPKIVQKILAEAKELNGETRIKLIVAEEIANSLVDWLKHARGVRQIEIAGSLRRRRETVGDLDISATCENSDEVMNRFVTSMTRANSS